MEANPAVYEALASNRRCITEKCAVGSMAADGEFWQIHGYSEMLSGLTTTYHSRHRKRVLREIKVHGDTLEKITVPVLPLSVLLDRHGLKVIDFLSVDTEGSELDILKSIDFKRTPLRLISVENPYHGTSINRFLAKRSFVRLLRVGTDEIYIHRRHFFNAPTSAS